MSDFSTLTNGIQAAIGQFAPKQSAGAAIVQEDDEDVSSEILKAQQSLGMMILIGIPEFKNQDKLADVLNAIISVEILIREVPALWRVASNANPIRCQDLGKAVAAALQGAVITGFEKLRVIHGESLGNIRGKDSLNNPTVFQDYLLVVETVEIFNPAT